MSMDPQFRRPRGLASISDDASSYNYNDDYNDYNYNYSEPGDSSSVLDGSVLPRPPCGQPFRRRRSTTTKTNVGRSFLEAMSCLCIGTSVGGTPCDYVDDDNLHEDSYQRRTTTSTTSELFLNALAPAFSSSSASFSTTTTASTTSPSSASSHSSLSSYSNGTPVAASPHRSRGNSDGAVAIPASSMATTTNTTTNSNNNTRGTDLVVPSTYIRDIKTGVLVQRSSNKDRHGKRTKSRRSTYTFRPLSTLTESQQQQQQQQQEHDGTGSNQYDCDYQVTSGNSKYNNYYDHTRTRSNATNNTVDSIYTIQIQE